MDRSHRKLVEVRQAIQYTCGSESDRRAAFIQREYGGPCRQTSQPSIALGHCELVIERQIDIETGDLE